MTPEETVKVSVYEDRRGKGKPHAVTVYGHGRSETERFRKREEALAFAARQAGVKL